MSDRELWQNTLVQIELATTEASFRTWFKGTDILKRDGGVVSLAVPSKIVKEWLREKHHKLVLKTLRALDPSIRGVEYVVHKNLRTPTRTQIQPQQYNTTIELQDLYIDKRDNLNPRYTFENFVVGPFNQLAHAAAQAVLQRPGLTYNPLFIYGHTGRGKTHLIQAIGNAFKKTHSNKKVFYVTSDRFTNDLVNAIRAGRAGSFKDQYRQYDILIMDDIQFIADKEKTQEELFHLFNSFHDNNKQIIFSSDVHPSTMLGFEARLRGRFSAGMIAEVPEPDVESRIAILKAKAEQYHFQVTNETIQYIARNVPGNIRELEGVLNSVICKTQLKGGEITIHEVASFIKNSTRAHKGVSVVDVVKKISQYYGIEEQSIYEKTRKKEVVKPRQIIMYILREEFNISYPSIGEQLGGRDHTTVIHSCEKIKGELRASPLLTQEIDQIKAALTG
ncbi:chromosomal replication initiator protein DnaA [Candidatus Kaiserbacteria bacterium]|nr:chromosomal replication initiator protein DnaA [Candidatus Kaiserbacteria bacterium]